MTMYTTTQARAILGKIVDRVRETGKPIAIGKGTTPQVLVIQHPDYNPAITDEMNLAVQTGMLDFLADEPELYTDADLVKVYGRKR